MSVPKRRGIDSSTCVCFRVELALEDENALLVFSG